MEQTFSLLFVLGPQLVASSASIIYPEFLLPSFISLYALVWPKCKFLQDISPWKSCLFQAGLYNCQFNNCEARNIRRHPVDFLGFTFILLWPLYAKAVLPHPADCSQLHLRNVAFSTSLMVPGLCVQVAVVVQWNIYYVPWQDWATLGKKSIQPCITQSSRNWKHKILLYIIENNVKWGLSYLVSRPIWEHRASCTEASVFKQILHPEGWQFMLLKDCL